ncbi:MED13L [Cordylochernes scorpioides]|uniref:Mediator of RNA polymerase II transcription subunit 13 n=1 Tax=Cordylochernes scorpioides TaxID=51811 RepID=A0ABY6JY76_9ARAC|nr:MED13L [Cordylochernes scorpioides]
MVAGGMKMRYPASYVYVSEYDDPTLAKGPSSSPNPAASTLLTPPMSPCDPHKPSPLASLKSTLRIKHQVWKDAITVIPSHEATPNDDPLGQWGFCDAFNRTNCSCSRCGKSKSQPLLKPGDSAGSNTSSKQRLKNLGAFHRRTQETASAVELDNYVAATPAPNPTTTIPTSTFQYKVPGTLRSTTPNGLPQLFGQPSIIGSPHPSTPLLDGPNSSSTDPTMPTLSPHPPPLHREEGEDGGARPATESLDQTVPPPSSSSQSPITLPEVKSEPKPASTAAPEQIFSPYQMTLEKGSVEGSPAPASSAAAAPTPAAPPAAAAAPTQPGLKPPVLPTSTNFDPEETNFNSLLYDYSSLTQPLWEGPPPKRQRRMHKNWSQKAEFAGGNDPLSKEAMDADLPLKPIDPYEFNDEFDESSPSAFRNKMEVFIKEEEKAATNPAAATTTPQMGPLTPKPQPDETPAAPPNADLGVVSPPTPRNQGASLTREEDLQVTEHDLEQLFDTSSDESADVMNYPPTGTPGSTKLGPTTPEEFPLKPPKATTVGILGEWWIPGVVRQVYQCCGVSVAGPAELTRMFPTPPSLEHNTASSPCNPCTDPASAGTGAGGPDDLYPCSPAEANKDWSYVYKPQVQAKFVGSSRYAPLPSLHSSTLPPLPAAAGGDYTYKQSWRNDPPPPPSNPPPPTALPTLHHPAMETSSLADRPPPSMMMIPSWTTTITTTTEWGATTCLQGPANKTTLHHHPAMVAPPPSNTSPPETSGLLVNLMLSDSLLNVFKDHNFSSCTLCVCNMDIRGSDASLLPSSHLVGPEEPQEKCTCGFSAVVNRHQSYRSGLFYEDEVEITGFSYEPEPLSRPKKNLALVENRTNNKPNLTPGALALADQMPHQILDLIKSQCSILNSPCTSFSKSLELAGHADPQVNMLEHTDGCEVTFLALEAGKQAFDNIASTRMEENLKNTCLHKWPYLPVKSPSNTSEVMQLLRTLQPLLQECFKKRPRQGLWEVTYTVSGPLTWRQFHRLSEKGTEDQCEPQPIPTLLVGYDKDWATISPFALKFWDYLSLEPSSSGRDVAYVVVAPDNQFLTPRVGAYFRELSGTYEAHRLGRHCPLPGGSLLRDGILSVSGIKAEADSSAPLDDWFNIIGDGPVASHLRLYAQACRLQLAPHLAMQQLDSKTLLESASSTAMNPPPPTDNKPPEELKPVIIDSSGRRISRSVACLTLWTNYLLSLVALAKN